MLKRIALSFLALFALAFVSIAVFLRVSPQFGGKAPPDQRAAFAQTGHYADGKFLNQVPTHLNTRIDKMLPMMYRYFTTEVPDKVPAAPLPMVRVDPASLGDRDSALARLTWFGHSACLLEIEGAKILFDPMFGQAPAPLPFLTTHRFNKELPIDPERLPRLDAIVISHDHYDHLDYGTIQKLKGKTDLFYVPLGVKAHLLRWGVEPGRIRELDWGDSAQSGGFTFICAPARHFSGRGLGDGSTTLWASWVVKTRHKRIYFSGDSGYGPHFLELGRKYGPFDFVMMECGQYNEQWSTIHMMAKEAVQATRDLGGKLMLPIHWGAFSLSLHSWYDPIQTVTARAREVGQKITTPLLGQPVWLDREAVPDSVWWTEG